MQDSFLYKKLKEKVDILFDEISKEKNTFLKVEKLEEILKWNNTEKAYVKGYLTLLLECTKKNEISIDKMKAQLRLYKKAIPKDEFNKEFYEFDFKEKSSFEEVKVFLEKIKNIDFKANTLKEKSNEYKFIKEKIEAYSEEIKYNSPITYDNTKLYIYYLFYSYLENLEKKIEKYKNEKFEGQKSKDLEDADALINDIENSYKKFKDEQHKQDTEEILIKAKINRKYIALLEGNFMNVYLFNFAAFISEIYDNFIEKFDGNLI